THEVSVRVINAAVILLGDDRHLWSHHPKGYTCSSARWTTPDRARVSVDVVHPERPQGPRTQGGGRGRHRTTRSHHDNCFVPGDSDDAAANAQRACVRPLFHW